MRFNQEDIITDITRALHEDLGTIGDITSSILPEKNVQAKILTREDMLMCGQPWCDVVFATIDPRIKIEWFVAEGSFIKAGTNLCYISGPIAAILSGERTALNFLQTLAGTATTTYHYVQAIQGTGVRLLDTRKTLPGLRMSQKYAVWRGGGHNHRFGLYDAYLLKENHLEAFSSISAAIFAARQKSSTLFLEVEVQDLSQLEEALGAKPDRILLDNFSIENIKKAVRLTESKIELEASGGINYNNIRLFAETGVDFLSVGDLTKSLHAIDLSLLVI